MRISPSVYNDQADVDRRLDARGWERPVGHLVAGAGVQ